MSTLEARVPAAQTAEESVATYLAQHLEFFENHPGLLGRLKLPHSRGAAISLVERQVEVLRERYTAMEQKLNDFVAVARANDVVAGKMHHFTRRLLRASTRVEAVAALESSLREDFDTRHAALLLIGNQQDIPPQRFVRVVDAADPALKSFESLFASGKPRCGQARDSQRDFLFGAEGANLGSVALLPLGNHGSLGLLGLGSPDRDHFHPGMATEFLARLGELFADSLARKP